jgi:hypothetical protein
MGQIASTTSTWRQMKFIFKILAVVTIVHLSGCVPTIYGLFRNSLTRAVRVTLFNPRNEAYCTIVIPPNRVGKCDVQYGTVKVTEGSGRILVNETILHPADDRYFDFDRRLFYFDIKSTGLVPVAISVGRQWSSQSD